MQDDLLLGGSVPSVGPKVDPRNYETIHCDKCGGFVFENKYVIKRVSGMELGQGAKPMMLPLNVLVCAKCGAILTDDIQGYKLEEDCKIEQEFQNKSTETKSSIMM